MAHRCRNVAGDVEIKIGENGGGVVVDIVVVVVDVIVVVVLRDKRVGADVAAVQMRKTWREKIQK